MLNIDTRQLMAMAQQHERAGRKDLAEGNYREILRQEPGNLEALRLLAGLAYEAFRNEEAVELLRRAVAVDPRLPWPYANLGNSLGELGRLEEALAAHRKALELLPNSAEAHNNLGLTLMDLRRFDEAIACWRRALAIKPDLADAHWNMSLILLVKGQMAEGWKHYEWRAPALTERRFVQPRWDGAELGGRRILVHAEQGFGDTIQFVRYVRMVAGCGGKVVLGCQKELVPLLKDVEGVAEIVGYGDRVPQFDVHAPLLSLPGIFGTALENIPVGVPYLFARETLVEKWRREMAGVKGIRVGISWGVNPKNLSGKKRMIPLAAFEPLARVEGVQLISLQKGAGVEQLAEMKGRVMDLGGRLDLEAGAFMDTAAVMKNVDLVISADTATCHLAGALGVKVWTALPQANDWRWLLERQDTPWYPTMRLFRQERAGEWAGVFEKMAVELKNLKI